MKNKKSVGRTNSDTDFLMDKNSIKKGWRNTNGEQPESCDSIEGLYKTVGEVQEEFSSFTDSIADKYSDLNPLVLKRDSLKSEDRIKEKLRADAEKEKKESGDYKKFYDNKTDTYHCRSIRDCDGHTICMNNVEDVGSTRMGKRTK